jgi:hypothetical protein
MQDNGVNRPKCRDGLLRLLPQTRFRDNIRVDYSDLWCSNPMVTLLKGSLDRSIPHVMYWLGRSLQFAELAALSPEASPAQG